MNEENKCLLYFDKEQGFRLFTPKGEEITGLGKCIVNDNWQPQEPCINPKATITIQVNIVNEKPQFADDSVESTKKLINWIF